MAKKRKSASDKVQRKRETLAVARRQLQIRAAPLALGCFVVLRLSRLFGDEPWAVVAAVAYVVAFGILSIRWIVGYRRLKAKLGLAGEYDQLDENAAWSAKLLLIMFGGLAAFFVLLFGFISVFGKH